MDEQQLYDYCHELFEVKDGKLIRLVERGGQVPGTIAGSPSSSGYYSVRVNHKLYLVHRIIFLMCHGRMPKYVDHINQDKYDNRIENLRECSFSQNQGNVTTRKDNSSGVPGVAWNPINKNWRVVLNHNNVRYELGSYSTKEEAIKVRKDNHAELFGEFSPYKKEVL